MSTEATRLSTSWSQGGEPLHTVEAGGRPRSGVASETALLGSAGGSLAFNGVGSERVRGEIP